MKQYPSIGRDIVDAPIYAFDKLDGNNIRAEWTKKEGLHKFGSRKVLLGSDHPFMGRAIGITLDKYNEALSKIFVREQFQMVTCFFEYHSPTSFAGIQDPSDPDVTSTLIDIDVYKKGMPLARDFVKMFEGKVEVANLLYVGNPNSDFIQSVRESKLGGMTYEGVVCKGHPLKKGYQPNMFKVKSDVWVARVKARFADDPARLADLL